MFRKIDNKRKQAFKASVEAPRSSLREIMDLEMALNLSWNDYYSYEKHDSENSELLSTKMEREQLYHSYPGIDRQILDELFEANQFRLKDTIATIDQSLKLSEKFACDNEIWVTAEAVTDDGKSRVKSCLPFASKPETEVDVPDCAERYCDGYLSELRETMLEYSAKRKEFISKARQSYRSKKYDVASYYSDEARIYQNKLDDARKEIVDNIISANKAHHLDLHGLHSSEVLIAVSSFLSQKTEEFKRNKESKSYVDIITGWGAHSTLAPRIKPIVLNYLQSKKYKFQLINSGAIRVTLFQ